ncbi:MAG: non-canonical purine NTP pyrophosphatase [Candidatus Krumholzibacteria bacterium]
MEIALATRNTDKIREIEAILVSLDVVLVPVDRFEHVPEVVEDGETLEENALKKARAVRDATGLCALSDDTGLEVDVLRGAPGIYSSRYAGDNATYEDNVRKLLQAMQGVPLEPREKRSARFRCVAALALTPPVAVRFQEYLQKQSNAESVMMLGGNGAAAARSTGPDALVAEGILEGRIAEARRGTGGFGYDPVFEIGVSGKTLAEVGLEEKNRISHRYRALVEMRELLLRCSLCRER